MPDSPASPPSSLRNRPTPSCLTVARRVARATALLFGASCALASAQEYPSRSIRLLVGFPAGGGVDIVARILVPKLSDALRQQVVVDNRAGAGSAIASELTASAAPDGYTVLMITSSHAINAGLPRKLSYDSLKDFSSVGQVANAPLILVIHPSLAVKSPRELIALARARPGQLNYGSSGAGGNAHLGAELFKWMAKVDIVHVPYKGTPQALSDLVAGQLQVLFPTLPTALPHVRTGRVRALAVTSAKPSRTLPEIAPLADQGLPGYEATNWYGILVPAGTPKPVIDKLNATTLQTLAIAEVSEAIMRQGAEPLGTSPAEFERYLRAEIGKWAAVIKHAGISAD